MRSATFHCLKKRSWRAGISRNTAQLPLTVGQRASKGNARNASARRNHKQCNTLFGPGLAAATLAAKTGPHRLGDSTAHLGDPLFHVGLADAAAPLGSSSKTATANARREEAGARDRPTVRARPICVAAHLRSGRQSGPVPEPVPETGRQSSAHQMRTGPSA